jgi:hypothetical protein
VLELRGCNSGDRVCGCLVVNLGMREGFVGLS